MICSDRKVVAIHGKAQSGKDTLALALREQLTGAGYSVEIIGFADHAKEALSVLTGIPVEEFWYEKNKASKHPLGMGLTNRELLVKFGQGIRLLFGYDFWISRVERQMTDPNVVYIIPDIRDPFELAFCSHIGACTIKLKRDVESSASNELLFSDALFRFVVENQDMSSEEYLAECAAVGGAVRSYL